MKQTIKKSALNQTNKEPWWENISSKAFEDRYFVVEFRIVTIINEQNKLDAIPHLIKREVFKCDGVNFDHQQRADLYFDKLYDDLRNHRDVLGDDGKLITESLNNYKGMVYLDYYACEENGNVLYYLFTLDDWEFEYNCNNSDANESDIYPDDGSLEFEEN